jgi:alpha-beta hydrolase superfamily lysophospholipase
LIVLFLLFQICFYLFQEIVLFQSCWEPTGYVDKPLLKPVNDDDFVKLGEAQINYQKFLASTEPSKGTIFFLHGNRGNINQCKFVIKPFLDAGYDVWIMDYRGFGKSTGRRSEAALLADAQMVYKRIREEVKEEEIIVWGRSFGSGIAAFIAAGNSPKALVLETPYWSLPDAVCHEWPIVFPFLFRYKLPTHEYLCNVDCDVHLIHGDADEKIYFGSSEKLLKLCKEEGIKRHPHWIRGGRHNLRSEPKFEAVTQEILNP